MTRRARYEERRREFRKRLPEHYCPQCTSVLYVEDESCAECDTPFPADGWPSLKEGFDPCLGRVLGDRYLITRFLGVGGTGNVYRAESLMILRQFAVKIIDVNRDGRKGGKEKIQGRLEREIEALSRLRNPHIVPFYEVLELPGHFVGVVMDYIQGDTLEDLVHREGPLTLERTCNLGRQIAIGIHEAHEVNMTHRDLKPENVMIERLPLGDEFVHILDFGIVQLDDNVKMTQGFLGTPLYTSPEQAMGRPVDRRSDIYSLGALLFYVLTGRPPFVGNNSFEVLDAHIRAEIPTLEEAFPGRAFSAGIQDLVRRMLAKKPEHRPVDLSVVITTLDDIRNANLTAPEAPFSLERLSTADHDAIAGTRSTQPGKPALLQRTGERRAETVDSADFVDSDVGDSDPGSTYTRHKKSVAKVTLEPEEPRAEILRRQPSGKFKGPKRERTPTRNRVSVIPGSVSNTRTGTTNLDLLGSSPSGPPVLCALTDERRLVVVGPKNSVWVIESGHRSARRLYSPRAKITALSASSLGAVIGRSDGVIETITFATSKTARPFESISGEAISGIDTDPAGDVIVIGTRSGKVLHGRRVHRRNILKRGQQGAPVTGVGVDTHGDSFGIARATEQIDLFTVGSQSPFNTLEIEGTVDRMAFSPDGHILAALFPAERTVRLYHVFTGHLLMTYVGGQGRIMGLRFTGTNELLGLSVQDGRIYSWDLQRTMVPVGR